MTFLATLNTHRVGNVGLGSLILCVTTVALQSHIDAFLAAQPHWGQIALSLFDAYVETFAAPIIAASGVAAYLGRPATIPPSAEGNKP
jgi:hypothetical protein